MLHIQRLKAKKKSETISKAKGYSKATCEDLGGIAWQVRIDQAEIRQVQQAISEIVENKQYQ